MLFLPLVGLLLLYGSHRRLAERLNRLERDLAVLRVRPSADPTASEQPAPAVPAAAPRGAGQPAEPAADSLAALFERFVAGRLLIWTGAIALAAGGIFLIRHSIEFVTPAARMITAACLGIAMIIAGEGARRGRLLLNDARIAQALAGAGIAVLYATAWGSHLLYGLLSDTSAGTLLVLITAVALVLSLRHGAPTAALGLIGGFSTPLLVGEARAQVLPVLAYLALLDGAIVAIALRRSWPWLVTAAVAASFAWTGYFILQPTVAGFDDSDALLAGFATALLATLACLPARGPLVPRLPVAAIALLELALLVCLGDRSLAAWLVFGTMAGITLPLAVLRPGQRYAPLAALSITLGLLAFKAAFQQGPYLPWAAAASTLLFAAGLLPAAPRSRAAAIAACAAIAGPLLMLRALWPELLTRSSYGLLAILLAAAALGLLWYVQRRHVGRTGRDAGAFAAAGTAALLAATGAHDLVPADFVSAAWLVVSTGLLLAGVRWADTPLRVAGLALLTLTVFRVFLIDADELRGILRIVSFLGLGLALIGIGLIYGKVLRGKSASPDAEKAPPSNPRLSRRR